MLFDAQRHQHRAAIFKALGHPTRVAFVAALENGPLCVCDLQRLAGSDMSTVSKHLGVLKAAGIVQDEKRGQFVYYALRMPCVLRFLSCVDSVVLGGKPRP